MRTASLIRPKHILRFFSTHRQYTKEEYRNSVSSVKRLADWKEPFVFTSGYVDENKLFLSEAVVPCIDFPKADVLVLTEKTAVSLVVGNTQRALGVFKLGWQEDRLWLSLHYKGSVTMGYPSRENFDITPLTLHKPVRICLNGRTWHSMTGRRAHTYHEWDFLIEYLGVFSEATVLPELSSMKTIAIAEIKTINLRKDLY